MGWKTGGGPLPGRAAPEARGTEPCSTVCATGIVCPTRPELRRESRHRASKRSRIGGAASATAECSQTLSRLPPIDYVIWLARDIVAATVTWLSTWIRPGGQLVWHVAPAAQDACAQ